MSDIEFFTSKMSRGRIVRWMLEELGDPYETHWIEYGEQMKGAEYLAINPMGKVPAVRHQGHVITECPAICAYLANSYPERGLFRKDGAALADFYRWLFFAAGPLELLVSVRGMNWEVPEERRGTLGYGSEDVAFSAMERALEGREYICGDQFTAADVYFGSHIMWGMQFDAVDKRESFISYTARLAERPAYKESVKICEAKMAEQAQ